MKIRLCVGLAAIVWFLSIQIPVHGQAPAPVSGNTLWHWLGIPQGYNKIADATKNKNGNHPQRERKPPLKSIADPSNLESGNPAIKAAAQVKTEEDLKPQKIKAIKYLATIGCGCYPGVRDALMAALDDCTEEVRYQAAIALCQVAGNPCKLCDKNGCCNAEVMNKLNEMANGRDAQGCFKESSARVRAAAANALDACRRKNPPSQAPLEPTPERKEIPIEEPQPTKEMPRGLDSRGPSPTPAVPPDSAPIPTPPSNPASPSGDRRSSPTGDQFHLTNMLREDGTVEISDISLSDSGETTPAEQVAFHRRIPRNRVCPQEVIICPETTGAAAGAVPAPGETAKPGEAPGAAEAANEPTLPPSNALASNYGATSGPLTSAPNMIGDFFGSGGITYAFSGNDSRWTATAPMPGGAIPRFKMAENTSPIPQDRVYFDYNFYHNVPITQPSIDVNSYAPGFEKTFCNGIMSVEMRMPMANTLDNDVFFNAPNNTAAGEIGDIGLAFKSLLIMRDTFAISGGLAMSLPTAQDTNILFNSIRANTTVMTVENQSVHLMPFFGGVWAPNDRWFTIGYVQIDVDANGDLATTSLPYQTGPETTIGRLRDATYLYADLGLGYWVRRSDDPCRFFTGLAYVCEVHMNQSLESSGVVQTYINGYGFQVGDINENVSCTDLTVGTHLEIHKLTCVTAAFITPLTPDVDRQFDGQFRLFVNRRF